MSILISGYGKKSIAEQTGQYSYEVDISLNNSTGKALWGFSGDAGNLFGFRMESGRIYDGLNKFIYGYNNDEIVSFKGYVDSGVHNIYINNKAITLNGYRNTGNTNYFYTSTQNCSAQVNLLVSGNTPTYQFGPINFSGNNLTGTGIIYNNGGSKFKIYSGYENISGDYYTLSVPSGNISGANSGIYTVYRNFDLVDITQSSDNDTYFPFTFNTNFGDTTGNILVSTRFPIIQTLNQNLFNQINGATTGQGYITWDNFKGQTVYPSGLAANLTIYLTSGIFTGNFTDIFGVSTGNYDQTNFIPLNFTSGISGFSTNFSTYGQSGIAIQLIRNTYNSGSFYFNLVYSGYNTGIGYTISGV